MSIYTQQIINNYAQSLRSTIGIKGVEYVRAKTEGTLRTKYLMHELMQLISISESITNYDYSSGYITDAELTEMIGQANSIISYTRPIER